MQFSKPRVSRMAFVAVAGLSLYACATYQDRQTGADSQDTSDDRATMLTEDEKRQNIVEFFEKRRARYDVVATTTTPSGQIIDWIKPESQTPSGKLAAPPPMFDDDAVRADEYATQNPYLSTALPESLKEALREQRGAQTEVQADKSAMGPDGTVPIVRFNVDALIETYMEDNIALPDDPMELLTKAPPPAPESNDRYYAVWQRFGDVFGSAGRINIWDTTGPVGGETSIAQVAVIRGSPMQAIEAGKIEHSSFAPSRRPTFFTYFRTNGGDSGDWVGGYNALVDGWIQYSPSVAPGMSLVPWESSRDGPQYSLDVRVRLWEGNWWVWAGNQWAGYYPYCRGGDARPCDRGTLFRASGIRDMASRLDWYGEVFDESAPAATSTDMGSGAYANQRWRRAAYFRNMTYFWAPNTYWWWNGGSIYTTDSNCYSGDGPYYSSDPNWRNWYYFGGPGDEGAGCN